MRTDVFVILADPCATYDELTWLRTKGGFGRDVLGHPNCPPDHWWELAVFYPMEALTSTAGALFLLESPERWAETTKCAACGGVPWVKPEETEEERAIERREAQRLERELRIDLAKRGLVVVESPSDKEILG